MLIGTVLIFAKTHTYVMGGAVVMDFAFLAVIYLAFRMHRKDSKKNPQKIFELIVILITSCAMLANYAISTHNILDWGIKESEYIDTGDNHQAVPEPEEVYEEKGSQGCWRKRQSLLQDELEVQDEATEKQN